MAMATSKSTAMEGRAWNACFPLSRSTTISCLSVLLFFVVWQVAPELGLVNGRFTSQPTKVAVAALEVFASDDFFYHARISLTEFALGFALALVVSVPLGALLGTSKHARYVLDPPLMALYIAPTLVLLPIMVIWLGIGMASKVAVVFLGVIFPIIVNTMAGMREADPRLIRAARSFGASRLDIFTRILVPGSLPSILMGVRLAVGRGVLGVVVGELYVSQAGVGHQLMTYGSSMRIDRLLVYALVISVFGYTLTSLVRLLESRVRNWRTE
ncbi:ABC transporter permease [Chelativorans sp. AA-79]|uniref:ABC transporter permease n=1 Tax=Chelativorans sp. AA-79 TaxID=3028735 RepID=UPI0023F6259D|nr:ABC transporter permease [Chelativorans sp. AA-79]WEX10783.1 ABC transporter permease [Chelativorans sp. AA-79]